MVLQKTLQKCLVLRTLKKGVKVDIEDDIVVVDLNIIVDFGIKIPDVAWQVQENVKNAIETMTGLACKEVNIHVQGINMNLPMTRLWKN